MAQDRRHGEAVSCVTRNWVIWRGRVVVESHAVRIVVRWHSVVAVVVAMS